MEDRKSMAQTMPTGKKEWREIQKGKESFQEIVKMLVEFDERTGRHSYAPLKECHYMRKAISVGDPENLLVMACAYPSHLYYVTARLSNQQGKVTTCWVHEDGVAAERLDRKEEESHPVHQIVCLTDIFQQNQKLQENAKIDPDLKQYMDRADSPEVFAAVDERSTG
ncbi:MAG TPA: hypothetical protein DEA96_19410 [Leptospiraceae bacterium]|nr:hypothetical protein [Spirochaetaceae bacterium]HBS07150.1 hypothetical protein [Leptospiraceae bacterium]